MSETLITIPYRPRPLQMEFHKGIKRWSLLLCHRRMGKSVMAVNQLIKDAVRCKQDRPRFAYIAPSYKMAKDIVFDYLKYYVGVIPDIKINETELRVDFPNGARVRLYGADNPDSLRGIYLDGVVLDEYAQIRPSLFTEIIRPALSDRQGYAVFIGTPKGKNHFYQLYEKVKNDPDWYVRIHKASETGYVDELELLDAQKHLTADEYMQEYECSWEAAIKGAFYATELQKARDEQRICNVRYDSNLKVNTYWDIGYRDDTSIIFVQQFGKEIRIIDSYTNSGMTIADYAAVLREKAYNYEAHYFPWDAKIKPMSSGKSTIDVALENGIDARLTPSLSVLEGINQARMTFKDMYFDEEKTADLRNALGSYRREWNDKGQTFRANPLHDWSSHYADAFRYMAICIDKHSESRDDYSAERQYATGAAEEMVFNIL